MYFRYVIVPRYKSRGKTDVTSGALVLGPLNVKILIP